LQHGQSEEPSVASKFTLAKSEIHPVLPSTTTANALINRKLEVLPEEKLFMRANNISPLLLPAILPL
jgi:hypothetical protein